MTLTLIAVQLTASAYSPRVVDVFRNNRDMRILLGSYAISIFYGLIVLKLMKGIEGEVMSHSVTLPFGHGSIPFEYFVSFALWLGAFTFVALFPYMLSIIDLLKPVNIIKRLSEDITIDKISNYIEKTLKGVETSTVEDPVQPIVDIIYGALGKHDLETTRKGLRGIVELVIKVINTEEKEKKEGKISFYSGYICNHLQQVGKFAASIEDEESTREAILYLEKFGIYIVKQDLKEATEQVVLSLRAVGEAAADNGLKDATEQAALSLGIVGEAAADKDLEDATWQAALSLEAVGEVAADKGLKKATMEVATSLGTIGEAAAREELQEVTEQVILSLRAVGEAAADKGLKDAAMEAATSLE
ncbi:MAG: DUF2254 domain-containing protein, partial [Methanophagales archaeon]|nr:DUF2254 domain-containing protein [Methanophagales archaeon]